VQAPYRHLLDAGGNRAAAYAFFRAFGIVAIDYLASDLLPRLNEAAEEAI